MSKKSYENWDEVKEENKKSALKRIGKQEPYFWFGRLHKPGDSTYGDLSEFVKDGYDDDGLDTYRSENEIRKEKLDTESFYRWEMIMLTIVSVVIGLIFLNSWQ